MLFFPSYFSRRCYNFLHHNQMTVTWTSGYGISEAEPFVEWGPKGGVPIHSPAGTLTFERSSMCGA